MTWINHYFIGYLVFNVLLDISIYDYIPTQHSAMPFILGVPWHFCAFVPNAPLHVYIRDKPR